MKSSYVSRQLKFGAQSITGLLKHLALVAVFVGSQAYADELGIADYKHLGVASCATSVCHGKLAASTERDVDLNEYRKWSQEDRHAQAYRTLELPESKRIAANLKLPSAATAKICLDCHTDNMPVEKRGPKFRLDDGVGCEACHGGSEKWIESHAAESATHKDNLSRGMYTTEQPLKRAELCLTCHLGTKDRFATHSIMGAGHPRLTFELETYTANQPAHFTVDADYEQRKGKIEGVNLWLTGQIESSRTMLELLQTDMFNTGTIFPELAFYDCHSCHHPMDKIRWNEQRAGVGIKPGTLRLQTQHLVILQAITEALDPAAVPGFVKLTNALVQSGQRDISAVKVSAKNLLDWLNSRDGLSKQKFDRADIAKIRRVLLNYGASDKAGDYAAAEQIVLGVQSLSYALGEQDTKRSVLDALYKSVQNDTNFSPQSFAAAARAAQQKF